MADPIGTLTLEINERGTLRLVLRGPEVPVVRLRPAIGVSRDEQGRYHLVVGANDYVYNIQQLPAEFQRMLRGRPATNAPSHLEMPTCRQLRRANGTYLTYADYVTTCRLFHGNVGNIGTVWPEMPPAVYEMLIQSCRQSRR
jgi:hypothetical protein